LNSRANSVSFSLVHVERKASKSAYVESVTENMMLNLFETTVQEFPAQRLRRIAFKAMQTAYKVLIGCTYHVDLMSAEIMHTCPKDGETNY